MTTVVLRYCPCLRGLKNRVHDSLVAEGFDVKLRSVLRPGVLQIIVGDKVIWSFALWRRQVPDQKTLAGMIHGAS